MPGISRRAYTLASTALALGLLTALPARAQSTSSVTTIESQIKALQRELQELKRQMQAKDATVRAAREAAQQAKESAAQAKAAAAAPPPPAMAAPPGTMVSIAPGPTPNIPGVSSGGTPPGGPPGDPDVSKGAIRLGGVTISLGGTFLAGEGAFRTKNQSGDLVSSFNGIPFSQTAGGHESQVTLSGRQTRVALLAYGDPTPSVRISGYVESDFLAGSTNGNYNETSSYSPRIRQGYAAVDYDDRPDDIGLHVLAGQAWTLLTPNTAGILPRKEALPPVIDPQYVVGYTWARQAQIRLSADILDHKLWAALSVEQPQSTFSLGGYTAGVASSTITLPSGATVNYANAGIAPNNTANFYSVNGIPDFVGKIAADPGFGHYELVGLLRVLTDRVELGAGKSGSNDNSLAGGVGANANIRVFPLLDLQGNVLVGQGIGRYGSGQLPDATVKPNGELSPIPEVEAMVGGIAHPLPTLDVYGFAGAEIESKDAFSVAGKGYGYGSPLLTNTGCGTELSAATCTANTKALYEGTVGFWYRPYKGNYGTLQTGAQYEHILRDAFIGVGGTPRANEDTVMLSLRYYPFQ
jgi:hypothetical protein